MAGAAPFLIARPGTWGPWAESLYRMFRTPERYPLRALHDDVQHGRVGLYRLERDGRCAGMLVVSTDSGRLHVRALAGQVGGRRGVEAVTDICQRLAHQRGLKEVFAHTTRAGLARHLRAIGWSQRNDEYIFDLD